MRYYKTFAVFSATVPGMPLIYSGQEVGLNKRLEFFEKDEIDWNSENNLSEFYKTLLTFKKEHPALWNGEFGGSMKQVKTNADDKVFAFIREKDNDKVLVILNLSNNNVSININFNDEVSKYKSLFAEKELKTEKFDMLAWEYNVFYLSE